MNVTVHCYSVLRKYGPGGEESGPVALPAGARVADLLEGLGIPEDVERVLLLNGRNAEDDALLAEGDTVTLFPPVAGG